MPRSFQLRKPIHLLVVAPHPDDEVIMGAGLLLRNRKIGGKNEVVYITSGSHPAFLKFVFLRKLYRHLREREARQVMSLLGVPSSHLHFLRLERDKEAMPQKTARLVALLRRIFQQEKPDMILTSAYEGGHCIHDWTNYAVFVASREERLLSHLYEVAEYRPRLERGLKGIQSKKMFSFRFAPPPLANLLHLTTIVQVPLSRSELSLKKSFLKKYRSQNLLHSLTKKFSFPAPFRLFPGHDYEKPPFLIKKIAGISRSRHSWEDIPYGECGITFRTFRRWITGVGQ